MDAGDEAAKVTRFAMVVTSDDEPATVWRRLTSVARHTAAVPFTTVTTADGDDAFGRAGARITARTSLGRFGFDDPMTVEQADPPTEDAPGHLVMRKTGRVVIGTVRATISRRAEGGSTVAWEQDIGVVGAPGRLAAVVARPAYATALRRIISGDPAPRAAR